MYALTGRRPLQVLARTRAWARPCPLARLDASHVRDYLDGVSGGGPGWGATAFYAVRRHAALEDRWRDTHGWRIVAKTEAHVYWSEFAP